MRFVSVSVFRALVERGRGQSPAGIGFDGMHLSGWRKVQLIDRVTVRAGDTDRGDRVGLVAGQSLAGTVDRDAYRGGTATAGEIQGNGQLHDHWNVLLTAEA